MAKEPSITAKQIENRIFTVRGFQVMLDSHLAEFYNVSTGRLNEQVRRNNERFPDDFMFQLTSEEWDILISQNVTSFLRSQNAILEDGRGKHRKYLPYVFTEQGVAGLSGVLKSQTAVLVHVAIMRAFIAMRKMAQENLLVSERLGRIELKQFEEDQKFNHIFKALESHNDVPNQGVFFNGQVFDAYELTSKIIRSAEQSIVLIDGYIDETTLTHLSKKRRGVNVLLLTKNISKQMSLDIKKANEQYSSFSIKPFKDSHDRFLIIDNQEIFHLGASLKDLGKKWFAYSKLNKNSVKNILASISELM